MNEIEKMYEKCNFEKSMGVGSPLALHPFTTEKQLELVKWLFDTIYLLCLSPLQNSDDFENSLAELVNNLWQDMAEEERKQIKEILK